MNVARRRLCAKISTVLGAFLLLSPNGVPMFWGNISVYVLSYCVVVEDSTFGVEAPWILATHVVFTTLGLVVYSFARKYLGKRLIMALGIVLHDLGYFCSYLAVQSSFMMLNAFLAGLSGFGNGILMGHALRLALDVATNDTGLITSIVNGAFYWGACVLNLVATFFVNPENKMAAATIGHAKYFTQRDVLGKVPSLFLVLGSVSVGIHLVASLLLNVDPCWSPPGSDESGQRNEVKSRKNSCDNDWNYGSNEHVETKKLDLVTIDKFKNDGKCLRSIESEKTVDWSNGVELTPTEMLKTPSFYALFVTTLMAEYSIVLVLNYFKSFGQLWIDDDHFLTQIGMVMIFSNGWVRLLWGYGMDNIGTKACFVLNILLLIFMSVWLYFTVMIHKWFYAVVVIAFGSLAGAFFSGIIMAVVCLYGKTHFSTNYGIVRSSSVILAIACPFVTDAILINLGWYYIFGSAALVSVFSLILMLFCIPLK